MHSKMWLVSSVVLLMFYDVNATTVTVDNLSDANASIGGTLVNDSFGLHGDLRGILNYINQTPGTYTINLAPGSIDLEAPLPIVNMNDANSLTFIGSANPINPTVLDGANAFRGLFIANGTVTIQNMVIQNTMAQGGNGGGYYDNNGSGGGGLGAGGALFIDQANVTLSNTSFGTTSAQGGNGGTNLAGYSGAGGGGMGGDGGIGASTLISNDTNGVGGGGGGGLGGQGGFAAFGKDNLSGGGGGGGGGAGWNATGGSCNNNNSGCGGGGGGGAGVNHIGGNGDFPGAPGFGSTIGQVQDSIGGGGGGGCCANDQQGNGGTGGATDFGDGANGGNNWGGGGGGGNNGETGRNGPPGTGGTGSINGGGGGGGGGNHGGNGGPGGNGGGGGGGGGGSFYVAGGNKGIGGTGGYGGGGGGGGCSEGLIPGTSCGSGGDGGLGGGGGGAGNKSTIIPGLIVYGGNGNFGGGGGDGGINGNGGQGGFGAGGGGGGLSAGNGGEGGGSGSSGKGNGGGGGAGLGGAIFVNSGGSLTFLDSVSTSNSSVIGGNGGGVAAGGTTAGADIFVISSDSGNTITFSPPASTTVTINNSISDDSPISLSSTSKNGFVRGSGVGTSLLVNGNGTVVLKGANTYSGPTTVNNGTLNIANDTALGNPSQPLTIQNGTLQSGASTLSSARLITLVNNGTIDTQINNVSLSGAISGNGSSLIKQGDGVLFLSGNNTYTGGTKISGGTLNVENNQAFSSCPCTLANGSTLQIGSSITSANQMTIAGAATIDTQVYNMTLSGEISGDSLNKQGDGVLTFIGSNSHAGGTTINRGKLNIRNDHSLGTGPCALASGTTLQAGATVASSNELAITGAATIDTQGYQMTLSGPIRGGSLTKQGKGKLSCAGSNTYSGGTIVSNGTLNIADDNALGSGICILAHGTTLEAGAPVIPKNELVIAGTATIDTQIHKMTILGPIGGGSLVKQGVGSLFLSGNNTYSGSTTVREGILSVNGSIVSPVLVQPGAILKGVGTINANVVSNGIIQPGNSIGTLNIGSLNIGNGTVAIEISPTQSSLLNVSGTAYLTGHTLLIIPDPGIYAKNTIFTILNGTINGSFSNLISPLNLNLLYFPTYLQIEILEALSSVGGGNSQKIIQYLNSLSFGVLGDVLTALQQLTPSALFNATKAISPSRNATATYVGNQAAFSLSDTLSSHFDHYRVLRPVKKDSSTIAALEHEEELLAQIDDIASSSQSKSDQKLMSKKTARNRASYNIWMGGFADKASQKAQSQTPSFDYTTGAVLAAFDDAITDDYLVGAGLGYVNSSIHEHDGFGKGRLDVASAVLYGSAFWGNFYLELAFWNAYQRIHNVRNVFFTGFDQKATSNHNAYQGDPHLGLGYDFNVLSDQNTKIILEPFTTLDWAYVFENGFKEHGAGILNMQQSGRFSSILRTEAGLNNYVSHTFESQSTFIFRLKLSYINEAQFHVGLMTANLVGLPGSFTVNSFTGNQNLISPRVEFFWKNRRGGYASLAYDGEFGSNSHSNEAVIKIGHYF